MREFPFYLAGKPSRSDRPLDVINPFDRSVVGRTWLAGEDEFDRAADAAVDAPPRMRDLATYERAAILSRVSAALTERREEIARVLAGEAGKPIRDALVETDRASMTFQVAAEAARQLHGELIPLDLGAARTRPRRHRPTVPDRTGRGDFAVQLSAQSHRSQDRTGDRGRQPDRPQARDQDAALGALSRGARRRRGAARGGHQRPADGAQASATDS